MSEHIKLSLKNILNPYTALSYSVLSSLASQIHLQFHAFVWNIVITLVMLLGQEGELNQSILFAYGAVDVSLIENHVTLENITESS
jgi:hypothetical protein